MQTSPLFQIFNLMQLKKLYDINDVNANVITELFKNISICVDCISLKNNKKQPVN